MLISFWVQPFLVAFLGVFFAAGFLAAAFLATGLAAAGLAAFLGVFAFLTFLGVFAFLAAFFGLFLAAGFLAFLATFFLGFLTFLTLGFSTLLALKRPDAPTPLTWVIFLSATNFFDCFPDEGGDLDDVNLVVGSDVLLDGSQRGSLRFLQSLNSSQNHPC